MLAFPRALVVMALVLPLPSLGGLTIPAALLCLDPDLEQHLLAGVDMPDAIASIVSEVGAARQSACSAASTTGGAESTIGTTSQTSTLQQASSTPLPGPLGVSALGNPSALPIPTPSSTSAPVASAIPSLRTSTLAPAQGSSKTLPILLGVLIPVLVLTLLAIILLLLRRRRRRHDQQPESRYPYLSDTPSASGSLVSSQQQPFWRSIGRRPQFVTMPTSSTTATIPWDPLPPRPGGSRSTLPLSTESDMAEQRVLYLVGSRGTALTPGTLTGASYEDAYDVSGEGFPWGQSETELGGGRTPTGRAVEIAREREASVRTGAETASLESERTGPYR